MNYSEELNIILMKGLTINNRDECENIFEKYGFYRFIPYISIFERDRINADFSEVISLYSLDEELREIIGKLSMLIELNVKAKIIEETKDIPWNSESLVNYYIINPSKMETLLSDIIEQHKDKIKTKNNPEPTRQTTSIRKILRVASFGDMYSIYSNLNSIKKKAILLHYDVPREKDIPTFKSRLFSLRKIRNARGHHEMCIMNPTYIRISTPFNNGGLPYLFDHTYVLLRLCKSIDQIEMINLRGKIIKLFEQGCRELSIDILKIIGAPKNRKEILTNI